MSSIWKFNYKKITYIVWNFIKKILIFLNIWIIKVKAVWFLILNICIYQSIFFSLISLVGLINNFLWVNFIFYKLLNGILDIKRGIYFNILLLLALLEILIHAKLSHNLRIVLAVLHRYPSLPYFII